MKARLALLAVVFCWLATPAFAHRLDEYLQATTITLEKDRVVLQLRLTPGVAVAAQVLARLDANGDGTISDAEQQAYAEQVRRDLSLAVDGRPVPLRLVSSTFPPAEEITGGVGDILLTFDANLPAGSAATHRLTFENHHQSAVAVYLVNCLLPRDPGIHVVAQDRSYDQARYQLDFSFGTAPVLPLSASLLQPSPRPTEPPVFKTFFWHGVHHILTGYDHLLFVSALVLGAATLWDLIKVVTAFTLAHSLTLTLAALNLVHVSGRVVEPLISASIVCVALQNIFWPERSRGWSRLGIAFFFGLFHGLGFAGGLLDVMHQMPRETVLLALFGFSLGVEAGHQAVLLPLFGALKAARWVRPGSIAGTRFTKMLQRFGSAGIATAGVYYLCLALTDHS